MFRYYDPNTGIIQSELANESRYFIKCFSNRTTKAVAAILARYFLEEVISVK